MTIAPPKRPLILMFSGQGSQYFQMGKELYEQGGVFRDTLDEADRIVQRRLGRSLGAEIYGRARSETFDELCISHPALVAVEVALFRSLLAQGIVPDQVWGTSLGEYVAAVAAGIWSYEAALEAVLEQARLAAACPPGGMLAVLEPVDTFTALRNAGHEVTLAGVNFARHFTLAADLRTLDAVEATLKARSVTFQRLPVRHAFHSAAVDGLREPFLRYCRSLTQSSVPRVRFVSSMHAGAVAAVEADHFWEVVRAPMRFADTVARLTADGPADFVDCGPSGTAATFVKYNLPAGSPSAAFPLLTPFHQGAKNLQQLKRQRGLGA